MNPDLVCIPRALWARIYWALELYGDARNWEAYLHKRVGLIPAPVMLIRQASAKRVLDAISPDLFEMTLEPETES